MKFLRKECGNAKNVKRNSFDCFLRFIWGAGIWRLSWLFDKNAASWQNDLIEKHYAEIENIYRQMRGWRHDYHNHIQAIKGLALGVSEELDAYLNRLDSDLSRVDTFVKTGNIMIDAILNSKLSLAQTRGINVNAKAYVPETLNVSVTDLCVIIGNLLDNAMEASVKIPDKTARFIRVYIDIMREQLYISVSNSTYGKVRRVGAAYLTSHLCFLTFRRQNRISA